MVKVLITILPNFNDSQKLQEVFEKFDQEDYMIEVFDAESNIIQLGSLPDIVDYLKAQERYANGIDRITVLSNIRPLLFSWYRCYNSLISDFIYIHKSFSDQDSTIYDQSDLIDKLSHFDNIESDPVEGKIYIDLNHFSSSDIDFLLINNRFSYFNHIKKFNYSEIESKRSCSKIYSSSIGEFQFLLEDDSSPTFVDLNATPKNSITTLSPDWFALLKHNSYFTLSAMMSVLKLPQMKDKQSLVLSIFIQNIKLWEIGSQNEYYTQMIEITNDNNMDFYKKLALLCSSIELDIKSNLLKDILTQLVHDHQWRQYHYPLLVSSLAYISRYNLEVYPELYSDRKFIFDNIINYYRSQVETKKISRKPRRVALVAGQMLAPAHAPTNLVLNYLDAFRQYHPEYEVKVFTEDIFYYCPGEVAFPGCFASVSSASCYDLYEPHLGYKPNIYYSDASLQRSTRIQMDIDEVSAFEPHLLLVVGTDYSFIAAYLRDQLPVINFTMGEAPNPSDADLYVGGYKKEDILKEYIYYNISGIDYCQLVVGLKFSGPKTVYTRSDYFLSTDDFVIVTVGNRLISEMSPEFIDLICNFMQQHKNIRWIIVGKYNPEYLSNHYSELLLGKKIVFIEYSADLPGLYEMCDVYVNPFRQGGGFSGYMAMNQSLPVVTMNINSDVGTVVGDYYSSSNITEYERELFRLYNDKDYYEKKAADLKKIITDNHGFPSALKDLINKFELAEINYEKRK